MQCKCIKSMNHSQYYYLNSSLLFKSASSSHIFNHAYFRKCTHKGTGRVYALKCLKDTARSEREADLMWRCRDCPNVVQVVDVLRTLLAKPDGGCAHIHDGEQKRIFYYLCITYLVTPSTLSSLYYFPCILPAFPHRSHKADAYHFDHGSDGGWRAVRAHH